RSGPPSPRGTVAVATRNRGQPVADLSASLSALASSGDISTTRRPPPSRGTRMTMPRPSLVTSSGPSPVRGFMAAIAYLLDEPTGLMSDSWCPLSRIAPPGPNQGAQPPRRGAVASGPRSGQGVSAVSDVLLVDRSDGVATLTLNRPESMNSLSVELKVALRETVAEIGADPAVRAVVLTGTGRGFCVGQDLREHVALLEANDPAPLDTVTEHYNPIVTGLVTMPKPVVAAVNGMAAGAGAGIAFACDFRIAANTAGFLLAFANVGLTLDSGVSWTLPRIVGSARATALCLLAEPVAAEAALEM